MDSLSHLDYLIVPLSLVCSEHDESVDNGPFLKNLLLTPLVTLMGMGSTIGFLFYSLVVVTLSLLLLIPLIIGSLAKEEYIKILEVLRDSLVLTLFAILVTLASPIYTVTCTKYRI